MGDNMFYLIRPGVVSYTLYEINKYDNVYRIGSMYYNIWRENRYLSTFKKIEITDVSINSYSTLEEAMEDILLLGLEG